MCAVSSCCCCWLVHAAAGQPRQYWVAAGMGSSDMLAAIVGLMQCSHAHAPQAEDGCTAPGLCGRGPPRRAAHAAAWPAACAAGAGAYQPGSRPVGATPQATGGELSCRAGPLPVCAGMLLHVCLLEGVHRITMALPATLHRRMPYTWSVPQGSLTMAASGQTSHDGILSTAGHARPSSSHTAPGHLCR